MSFCFGTFRLQTAEKSRGWLEIRRFLDQTNRLGATYFWKNFRTNETNEKFSKNSKIFQNFFRKNFRKIFGKFLAYIREASLDTSSPAFDDATSLVCSCQVHDAATPAR